MSYQIWSKEHLGRVYFIAEVQGHTGVNLCSFQIGLIVRNIIANVAIELFGDTGALHVVFTIYIKSCGHSVCVNGKLQDLKSRETRHHDTKN